MARGEGNGSAVPHLLLRFQRGTESAYMARRKMVLPISANCFVYTEILARVPEAASLWYFAWDNYLLNMGN